MLKPTVQLDNEDTSRNVRDVGVRQEQALCRRALESGSFDAMSDQAWVTLCENVGAKARQAESRG